MTSNSNHIDPSKKPLGKPTSERRTIFVECTHTYHSDINTGIQRVVRNVLRNAPSVGAKLNINVVPVIIENSRYRIVDTEPILKDKQTPNLAMDPINSSPTPANTRPRRSAGRLWLSAQTYIKAVVSAVLSPFPTEVYWYARRVVAALLPFERVRKFLWAPRSEFGLTRLLCSPARIFRFDSTNISQPLADTSSEFPLAGEECKWPLPGRNHSDDILLLLDSSWSIPLWDATAEFKQQGGTVIGVVYDLIPISHPHACVPELTTAFTEWIGHYGRISDGTVTISKTVQNQFQTYAKLRGWKKWIGDNAPVRHFYLGSELDLAKESDNSSARMTEVFSRRVRTFLMVGSIEPRKMHAFVLDAFDQLWADGQDMRLIIVGRQAWRTEALLRRIESHPQLNRNLLVFRDASDTELERCYKDSDALIIASEIEGFGLPIVEAFQRNLSVICSDIPVFREVAGDAVSYFDLEDLQSLVRKIEQLSASVSPRQMQNTGWLTWQQSTENLLAAIDEISQTID